MKKIFIVILILCLIFQVKLLIKNVINIYDEDENKVHIINKINTDKKIVAITFDDGPHPKQTPEILKILKENNCRGTFFMVGENVELYPQIAKEVLKFGNEIGNHTYTHADIKQMSLYKVEQEFEKTQKIIQEVTGAKPNLFRPPFGYKSKKLLSLTNKYNCKIVMWSSNQDSKDWNCPGIDCIVKTTLKDLSNGDIILFHDYVVGKAQTASALKIILPEIKKRGFKVVPVSELLEEEIK